VHRSIGRILHAAVLHTRIVRRRRYLMRSTAAVRHR